jgi:tRNA (mo5U34)-methyltransferase
VLGLRRRRRTAAQGRFDEARVATPFVDPLDDSDLERLNELLPWHCFTVDSHGRPFGRPAWSGKRVAPQQVPDPRIELFDRRFGLAGGHVLEVGCFEGVHTVALCRRAAKVTAVDGRVENVVKTVVRCAFFGEHPTVLTLDLERPGEDAGLLKADVCHHVGVLYHLSDPVAHLQDLGRWIGRGLMLDTHYALPDQARDSYEAGGRSYAYRRYGESSDPFSGMRSEARWLLLDDIVELLRSAGFASVEVVERREERNGPRALLFAERGRDGAAP